MDEAMHLAQQLSADSGTQLRRIILGILGTLLIVVIAARAFGAFAAERYGKMIAIFGAGVLVAGFVFFPEQTISIAKGLWSATVG